MDQDQNTLVEDHRRQIEKIKYLSTYSSDNKQVSFFFMFLDYFNS